MTTRPIATPATRTLLVALDIAEPDLNRTHLVEAIMTSGEAWARPLDAVWVLRTRASADEIEARLAPLLGEDDGLMVQETRGEARLANAGLRWFRPKRRAADEEAAVAVAAPGDNVVDFAERQAA